MGSNRAPGLIAESIIMTVIATVALFLRCWARALSQQRFWWDDWLAIATLPIIFGYLALVLYWTTIGLGKHQSQVSLQNLLKGPQILFAGTFLYDISITLPKFSVLFFYQRIFGRTNRRFSICVWIGHGLVGAWIISAVFTTIFQCTPVKKVYDPESVPGGHCFSTFRWWLGTALASLITDAYILIIPLPMLWGLQTSIKRRLAVVGVFICGYCVVIVSIGRLVSLVKAGSDFESDLTWNTISYLKWVQCEGPVSLTSVCLPSVFSLVKHAHQQGALSLASKLLKTSSSKSGHSTQLASGQGKQPTKSSFTRLNEEPPEFRVLDQGSSARDVFVVARRPGRAEETASELDIELNQVHVQNQIDVTESREWRAV